MNVYEGNENYIFISYAHKDSDIVIPIVETLQQNGFRVWYDSGIEAGTEWPYYIETHLKNSNKVLVFMSEAAVESRNCRNEINMALAMQKGVLVIYLEKVELRYGMRLQLGSAQSMFRDRHPSEESFIRELCVAKILQSCKKDGADTDEITEALPKTNAEPKIMISNVCTIGTNDENDLWPIGRYSNTINRDQSSILRFRVQLLKPVGYDGTVRICEKIYNAEENLLLDETTSLDVKAKNNCFSLSWILKGSDGSFVPSGKYRAEISINGGKIFKYYFTVTSDDDKGDIPSADPDRTAAEKEIAALERKLARPKGLICALILLAGGLLSALMMMGDQLIGAAAVVWLLSLIPLCVHTKKYVWNTWIGSIALVVLFGFYYSIYSIIVGVGAFIHSAEWKRELARLKQKMQ